MEPVVESVERNAVIERAKRKRPILQIGAALLLVALTVVVTLLLAGKLGGGEGKRRSDFLDAAGRVFIPEGAAIQNDLMTQTEKEQLDTLLRRYVNFINAVKPDSYVLTDAFPISDVPEFKRHANDDLIGKDTFIPIRGLSASIHLIYMENPRQYDFATSETYKPFSQEDYDTIMDRLLLCLDYYYNRQVSVPADVE